jgi:hypothetical protein
MMRDCQIVALRLRMVGHLSLNLRRVAPDWFGPNSSRPLYLPSRVIEAVVVNDAHNAPFCCPVEPKLLRV